MLQQTEGLTHETARAALERAYGLLNEHDVARVPDIFTEDAEFQDDAWPEVMHGHAEIGEFLKSVWRAIPDLHFELAEGPFIAADGRVAAMVRMRGTMTGPLEPPGFAPTGGPVGFEYAGFYSFDGERFSRARIIINMQDAGVQIGAIPPPGSVGEKGAVLLQRAQVRFKRRGR